MSEADWLRTRDEAEAGQRSRSILHVGGAYFEMDLDYACTRSSRSRGDQIVVSPVARETGAKAIGISSGIRPGAAAARRPSPMSARA
jgi:hypothetical protein